MKTFNMSLSTLNISLTQSAFNKECANGKLSSSSLPGKLDQKKPFQSGSSNM